MVSYSLARKNFTRKIRSNSQILTNAEQILPVGTTLGFPDQISQQADIAVRYNGILGRANSAMSVVIKLPLFL